MKEIPKIIHYCWFGPKPIPELELKCIESWNLFCPDYKIMFWNEQSFDIDNSNDYVKGAYSNKMYAFVSDYVRLYALNKFGGIYLDTDIELLDNLDNFLVNNAFTAFENKTSLGAGIFGCVKGNEHIKKMLNYYDSNLFVDTNGDFNLTTICTVMMGVLEQHKLVYKNSNQNLKNMRIYERDFFYPKMLNDGSFRLTNKNVSIHHFSASWLTDKQKKRGKNIIWRNFFRPLLRKSHFILKIMLGDNLTFKIEKKIRNWIR